MKRLFKKLITPVVQASRISDMILMLPRVICGLLLAIDFGASKFGMPWTSPDSNLSLFEVSNWFVEDIAQYGGLFALSPVLFAWLGAASEAIGGLFLAIGFKTRIASFFLTCTMLVAIFFQKWDQGIWGMLPALGFLWVMLYSLVLGSGRFGLDYLIGKKIQENVILNTPLKNLKKKSSGKQSLKLFGLLLLVCCTSCTAQTHTVTFKVDMNAIAIVENLSIIGNESPLSWKKGIPLTDVNNNGIYEASIDFKTTKKYVKFRFVNSGKKELRGSDDRILWFKEEPVMEKFEFNEFKFYTKEKRKKLQYTKDEIQEDIKVLQEVLTYVHPNIYKYRDSISLVQDFKDLENTIAREPSLENTYKLVSKFAAKIRCSHTFTNPWNQVSTIEKAIFYQPNKIPFTFNRVGKRIFIDKNASENKLLEKGMEIIEINGVPSAEVLSRLAEYTTSDGHNYEKKLERLLVTGTEKFAMFDIFYPLEFGDTDTFDLRLRKDGEIATFNTVVRGISKTKRTLVLEDRYGSLESSVQEGWNFRIINEDVAHLSITSFAIQRNEFDWKAFLDNAFKEANKKQIGHLIVDIRGNEGGQGIVGEYILRRLLQQPLTLPAINSSVRYKKIPKSFEKHMNTWDRFPYDFSSKIASEEEGRFFLKSKYAVSSKTYKPRKDRFKGKAYLVTDASNSSATHLMAMYAKKIPNITLVGQATGGNQKGTNGSFIFFLKLPNTRVELDIPAIGMQVDTGDKTPFDGGVQPDILVEKKVADYAQGIDTELERILKIIQAN